MSKTDEAPPGDPDWADRHWTSRDGLRLHYRDYPGRSDRPPILMLHGLTRNCRDFETVAGRYAGAWRVLVPDFRGRGDSAWDPDPSRYIVPTYADDALELLDHLGISRAVFLGTSLGGLVTMMVAVRAPDWIAGAMLNDIGPELVEAGIDRIRTYVGKPALFRDLDDAAAKFRDRLTDVFPRYGDEQWRQFARRTCRQTDRGLELDYDMAIAEPFNSGNSGAETDGWPFFRALAGRPVLVLRGETSDLLSASVAERMQREFAGVEVVTIPDVGHAPDLDEPESIAAIDRLLDRVLEREAG